MPAGMKHRPDCDGRESATTSSKSARSLAPAKSSGAKTNSGATSPPCDAGYSFIGTGTRYAEQRRAQGNNEQRGLRYALSLIPVNRRYATNSPPARDRSARAGSPVDATLDLSWCEFITGDALEVLKALPSNSVQCIITSPPFWPLRRTFGGIGLGFEKTLQGYITNLIAVFRECKRVLRKDGLLWLHLEDAVQL